MTHLLVLARAAAAAIFSFVAASNAYADTAPVKVAYEGTVQTVAPVGVAIVVKKIAIGEDATVVSLIASFDSRKTNFVNLNDENAYLMIGNGQRLSLRHPTENRFLQIMNGQSMEGELVFPGRIPADASEVTLVFNEGHSGDDTSSPGLTVKIPVSVK